LSFVVDRLHELLLVPGEGAGDSLHQHFAVADDGRERRAQLVGDDPEKIRLQAIELA
jgi:hypothetical protein